MSLIFGINLVDRVYVAGDTRLSNKNKEGIITATKDRVIKVDPLSENIIAAFAGSARMASYVIKKLPPSIKDLDIHTFKDNAQAILGPIVDDYWRTIDSSDNVVIIFGGLNRKSRKKVSMKNIYDKVRDFSGLSKGQSMEMKPALFNEVMRSAGQPLRYPEPPDSYVFSVEIVPPTTFNVEQAEWGEYLAYGPNGTRKDKLSPIVFGKLEFVKGDAGNDNAMIIAALKEVTEKWGNETIGGPFFPMVINEELVGVITGRLDRMNLSTGKVEFVSETVIIGNTFYIKDENGTLYKLTPIRGYKDFGSLEI